jgi:hypothetical protein
VGLGRREELIRIGDQNLRKLIEKARGAAIPVFSEKHMTGINDGLLGSGEDTCVTVL